MFTKLSTLGLAIILTTLITGVIAVNALTTNNFDDSHTTARFGNSKVCGDHICGPGERAKMTEQMFAAQRSWQAGSNITAMPMTSTNTTMPMTQSVPYTPMTSTNTTMPMTQSVPYTPMTSTNTTMPMTSAMWTTRTGTITSIQDPGQGHENHQLAIVLPPSDKIYSGIVTWTSSQPMQIVELSGPIGSGDDKGQPIWTTDGNSKFALTLIDVNKTTGSFAFTGNALAFHLPQPTQFTVSYAVSYITSSPSESVKTGTITSIQDPGQGHETHQLALILPPSDNPYHGILTYSASEPVQLVSLIGPIDPSDKKGQLVYTMDGKTWYALVIEEGSQMGTWNFVGNAIAVHTKNTTPFQVSYTVDAHS